MSKRLVLVRHGQTAWNAVGRAQGHADISLDDTGRAQAAAAAPYVAAMQPVRLWSSDLARARETGAILASAAGLSVQTDPRLREYDVGVRSGLTNAEFEEQHPREYAAWLAHDETVLVSGEETSGQVRDRVLPALQDCLAGLGPAETGVVVMHGACLKVGLLALLGWPHEVSRTVRGMDNCAWTILGQGSIMQQGTASTREHFDGLRLVSYNETAAAGQHPAQAAGGDFAAEDAVG